MHSQNAFLTLTYNDENIRDNRLDYSDFQKFMKRLRRAYPNQQIGFNAVGEYGEKSKRMHWHAIIFNWSPSDPELKYTSDLGHKVFESETLKKLWPFGNSEFGSVTFHSAGYVSRYNAKKLVHGYDSEHDYKPIAKKSNKHAIGKKWLESHYQDVFNFGYIILEDGTQSTIPRYYEKWFKEHKPQEWLAYVTQTKIEKASRAAAKAAALRLHDYNTTTNRGLKGAQTSALEARREITKSRFKLLQNNLKL